MQALSRQLSRPRWESEHETIFVVFATVVFLLVLNAGLAMLCDRYRFVAKAYKLTEQDCLARASLLYSSRVCGAAPGGDAARAPVS